MLTADPLLCSATRSLFRKIQREHRSFEFTNQRKFKKPKQRDIQTRHMFACDADTQQFCSRISPCVCARELLIKAQSLAPPLPLPARPAPSKTSRTEQHKSTAQRSTPLPSVCGCSACCHQSSRRQSEPPASLSRDFLGFFCLIITTITATPAGIISVISLSLEEAERGNNRNDSVESARQLCLAAHPQAPLLLVLQPNTQSRAL